MNGQHTVKNEQSNITLILWQNELNNGMRNFPKCRLFFFFGIPFLCELKKKSIDMMISKESS